METVQPVSEQIQNSSKNPYKILFFLSLGLFLIISSILTTLLLRLTQNKSSQTQITGQIQNQTIPTETKTVSMVTSEPSPTITNSDKTFKVAGLEFEIPSNWSLISAGENLKYSNKNYEYYSVKFLTDYKLYKVYALADIRIDNTNKNNYLCDIWNPIKTQSGQVCQVAGSGYGHFYINLNNGKNYYISWGVESNQSPPKDLDGLWSPDNNLTDETMMNFVKSAKLITE